MRSGAAGRQLGYGLRLHKGLQVYRECLRLAESGAKWLTRRVLAAHDLTTDLGRDAAIGAVLAAADRMEPLDRDEAMKTLAESVGLAPGTIAEVLARRDEQTKIERERDIAANLSADLGRLARGDRGRCPLAPMVRHLPALWIRTADDGGGGSGSAAPGGPAGPSVGGTAGGNRPAALAPQGAHRSRHPFVRNISAADRARLI